MFSMNVVKKKKSDSSAEWYGQGNKWLLLTNVAVNM